MIRRIINLFRKKVIPVEIVGVTLTENINSIGITWTELTGYDIIDYEIQKKVGQGDWTIFLNTLYATDIEDTSVQSGTTYSYRIRGRASGNKYSEYSDVVSILFIGGDNIDPTAPTNVQLSNITQTSGTVTWSAATDNVQLSGYNVYVNNVKRNSVLLNTLSYNITGLSSNTSYNVYIESVDSSGNTAQSTIHVLNTVNPTPGTLSVFTPAEVRFINFNDNGVIGTEENMMDEQGLITYDPNFSNPDGTLGKVTSSSNPVTYFDKKFEDAFLQERGLVFMFTHPCKLKTLYYFDGGGQPSLRVYGGDNAFEMELIATDIQDKYESWNRVELPDRAYQYYELRIDNNTNRYSNEIFLVGEKHPDLTDHVDPAPQYLWDQGTLKDVCGIVSFMDVPLKMVDFFGITRNYDQLPWYAGDRLTLNDYVPDGLIRFGAEESYFYGQTNDFDIAERYQIYKDAGIVVRPCLTNTLKTLESAYSLSAPTVYKPDNKPLDTRTSDATSWFSYYSVSQFMYLYGARMGATVLSSSDVDTYVRPFLRRDYVKDSNGELITTKLNPSGNIVRYPSRFIYDTDGVTIIGQLTVNEEPDLKNSSISPFTPLKESAVTGLNLVNIVEFNNEPFAWWQGRDRHMYIHEYMAYLSACADGHQGALGPGYGMKTADPTMQIKMCSTPEFLFGRRQLMYEWIKTYRGGDNFIDFVTFNVYCNDGEQHNSTTGVSPEAYGLEEKVREQVEWFRKYMPETKVTIGEFGYDLQETSVQGSYPIGNKTSDEVRADWIIRSYMAFMAAGVYEADLFFIRSQNWLSNQLYQSSGICKAQAHYEPFVPWFYIRTMILTLADFTYVERVAHATEDVYIQKFENTTTGEEAYVCYLGTSVGQEIANFSLNLPVTMLSARAVEMRDKEKEGVAYGKTIASNAVEFTISEKPLFIIASTAAVQVPTAPEFVEVPNITPEVKLQWIETSKDQTGFTVERSDDNITFAQIGTTLAADIRTYTDSTVLPDTTYYYRVRGVNSAGNGAYSAVQTIKSLRTDGVETQKFLLNFTPNATTYPSPSGWVNIVGTGLPLPTINVANLPNVSGIASDIGIRIPSISSTNRWVAGNANGMNAAGVYPLNVTITNFYSGVGSDTAEIILTNLDPTKIYTVKMLASRLGIVWESMMKVSINGVDRYVDVAYNSNRLVEFAEVTGDVANEARFVFEKESLDTLYINAMEIIEYAVAVDNVAPTEPTNLSITNKTETSATLSWNASTDDVELSGYNVYLDDLNSGKQRVIFDSDANNEIDDQYAMAYTLMNGNDFLVEGITVNATYNGGNIANHYAEAERVLRLCNLWGKVPLRSGANSSFDVIKDTVANSTFDGVAAVDFIIQKAKEPASEKLVIISVGKLTNVALALHKDPSIIPLIKVIFLGSNYPNPGEYNLTNDSEAANYVLNTNVEFEMVTVSAFSPSGSDAVRVEQFEIDANMPGRGPIVSPVVGRNGGSFTNFGDYGVDLFANITLERTPPSRAMYDLVAVAILKNSTWGQTEVIPAPEYINNAWVDRPSNVRTIVIHKNFNRNAIINDLWNTMENYILVGRNPVNGTLLTTNTINLTGLSNLTEYSATVEAIDTSGNKSISDAILLSLSEGTDVTAPTIPTGLAQTASTSSSFTVSWNAATDNVAVRGYVVSINDVPQAETTNLSATYSGYAASSSFQVKVKAVDVNNISSAYSTAITATTSAVVTVTSAPTSVNAVVNSDTQVTVSWNAPTTGTPTQYHITRNLNGSWQTAILTGNTNITYVDTNLQPGTTVFYLIRAVNAAGNSQPGTSNTVTTTSGGPPPLGGGTIDYTPFTATTEFSGLTKNMMVYYPEGYDSNNNHNCFIFLHGKDEFNTTASNIWKNSFPKEIVAGNQVILDELDRLGIVGIFPQQPAWTFWSGSTGAGADGWSRPYLLDILDWVKTLKIDTSKITIGGLSMGAKAALQLVEEYPAEFHKCLALCPNSGPVLDSPQIFAQQVPVWVIHGAADSTLGGFGQGNTTTFIDTIKDWIAANPSELNVSPLNTRPTGVGHDVWTKVGKEIGWTAAECTADANGNGIDPAGLSNGAGILDWGFFFDVEAQQFTFDSDRTFGLGVAYLPMKLLSPQEIKDLAALFLSEGYNTVLLGSTSNQVNWDSSPSVGYAAATGLVGRAFAMSKVEFLDMCNYITGLGMKLGVEIRFLTHQQGEFFNFNEDTTHHALRYNPKTYDPNNATVKSIIEDHIEEIINFYDWDLFHLGGDELVLDDTKLAGETGSANETMGGDPLVALPSEQYVEHFVWLINRCKSIKPTQRLSMFGDMFLVAADFPTMHAGSLNGDATIKAGITEIPDDVIMITWHYSLASGQTDFPSVPFLTSNGHDVIIVGYDTLEVYDAQYDYLTTLDDPKVIGMAVGIFFTGVAYVRNEDRAPKPNLDAILAHAAPFINETIPQVRLAFPDATGFGKDTRGAYALYEQTNDPADLPTIDLISNTAEYVAFCQKSGPRLGIFTNGGVIQPADIVTVSSPYMTLAGLPAAGDGVLIRDRKLEINTGEIIIRNVKFRLGSASDLDCINLNSKNGNNIDNVIFDRLSLSWAGDENISINGVDGGVQNVTVQNCIIGECRKGHSMGILLNKWLDGTGPDRISIHKNLFVSNEERNPMVGYNISVTVINNLIHNWKTKASEYHTSTSGDVRYNRYKTGVNTLASHRAIDLTWDGVNPQSTVYFNGNDLPSGTDAISVRAVDADALLATSPHYTNDDYNFVPVTDFNALENEIFSIAGAYPRDSVDARLINDYIDGTGATIDTEAEVGGFPTINAGTYPAHNSGIHLSWLVSKGYAADTTAAGNLTELFLKTPGNGNTPYSIVEEFINDLNYHI